MLTQEDKTYINSLLTTPATGIKMLAKMTVNPLVSIDFDEAVEKIKEMRGLMELDQFTLLLKQIIIVLTKRHHKDVRERFRKVFKKEYGL